MKKLKQSPEVDLQAFNAQFALHVISKDVLSVFHSHPHPLQSMLRGDAQKVWYPGEGVRTPPGRKAVEKRRSSVIVIGHPCRSDGLQPNGHSCMHFEKRGQWVMEYALSK